MAISLSVNLNKVALLRNSRGARTRRRRSPRETCLDAGAYGLTLHWRADNRHTRVEDVRELRALCAARGAEFNLEGDERDELIALAAELRVTQFTLVPVKPGRDHERSRLGPAAPDASRSRRIVGALAASRHPHRNLHRSEPDMAAAAATGVDRVEIYTEPYAAALGHARQRRELERLARCGPAPRAAAGLGVNAGHDLDLRNMPLVAREVPEMLEVSIGHALIADALYLGLRRGGARYVAVPRRRDAPPVTC